MSFSMVASHSTGKVLKDVIFGASAACNEAIQKYGADKVTNGTIGAIMDDEGKLICIPTVEKVLRSLPTNELAAYAPIIGLPAYLEAVKILHLLIINQTDTLKLLLLLVVLVLYIIPLELF